ncbi:MAG: hypothetical protein K8R36_20885 [Planctomycetales bacterium]|nr:hypothetical protein [Planctomycetales bacterium]
MTSHVELAPREVWKAYQTIVNAGAGWAEQLDRYSVNAVVVDKLEHEALIKEIKFDPNWKRDYEDGIAVIYLRKKPL